MEISGKTLIPLLQHSRKRARLLNKGESARGRFGAVSVVPRPLVPTLWFPSDAPATIWGLGKWGEGDALIRNFSKTYANGQWPFRGSHEPGGLWAAPGL